MRRIVCTPPRRAFLATEEELEVRKKHGGLEWRASRVPHSNITSHIQRGGLPGNRGREGGREANARRGRSLPSEAAALAPVAPDAPSALLSLAITRLHEYESVAAGLAVVVAEEETTERISCRSFSLSLETVSLSFFRCCFRRV